MPLFARRPGLSEHLARIQYIEEVEGLFECAAKYHARQGNGLLQPAPVQVSMLCLPATRRCPSRHCAQASWLSHEELNPKPLLPHPLSLSLPLHQEMGARCRRVRRGQNHKQDRTLHLHPPPCCTLTLLLTPPPCCAD